MYKTNLHQFVLSTKNDCHHCCGTKLSIKSACAAKDFVLPLLDCLLYLCTACCILYLFCVLSVVFILYISLSHVEKLGQFTRLSPLSGSLQTKLQIPAIEGITIFTRVTFLCWKL